MVSFGLPPAIGLGSGSEIRRPLAIGVIGGLVLATILSLIVILSFYVLSDKILKRKKAKKEVVIAESLEIPAE